jgi:hypothetical protein
VVALCYFDLNDHAAINKEIGIVFAHNRVLIENFNRGLRLCAASASDEFDLNGALIDLFKKSVAENILNFERCADDS